jgi:hypothetical protein
VECPVLASPLLTDAQKLVYVWLCSYRNKDSKRCHPATDRIVAESGFSKNTIIVARNRLEELGVIRINRGGGSGYASEYYFVLKDGTKEEIEQVLSVLSGSKRVSPAGQKGYRQQYPNRIRNRIRTMQGVLALQIP